MAIDNEIQDYKAQKEAHIDHGNGAVEERLTRARVKEKNKNGGNCAGGKVSRFAHET
jgi:hypothetical protein